MNYEQLYIQKNYRNFLIEIKEEIYYAKFISEK